jgi:pyruvate dehydrogenase E1 component alpha subunit
LGEGLIPDNDVVEIYKHILVCRHFDEIAFKLQRSGRMGTYPENKGQEIPSIGAAYVLQKKDWMVTCYRENAGLFWRGLPMEKILLHWMGDERGNQIDECNVTPLAIAIGSQMLHAAGLAWAGKYKKDGSIACTFFGDGATSEGDFHEAANFAANLDLPVVFVCQNNGWAISTPTKIECSAPTVAQRGLAYGMDCVQVDGNDLFAMVKVMRDATKNARENNRPTFIEAKTYRLGDHTTADDARRYRDADELEMWKKRDPIIRLRKYLESKDLWTSAMEEEQLDIAQKTVAGVVKIAEEIDAPTTNDIFDSMYLGLTPELQKQRQTLRTSSIGQNPSQIKSETQEGAVQ